MRALLSYDEIFQCRYGRDYLGIEVSNADFHHAASQLVRMSDEEYSDWQAYKSDRLDTIRKGQT